jgi:hypothetical protein
LKLPGRSSFAKDAYLRVNNEMLGELLQMLLDQNTVLLLPDSPILPYHFKTSARNTCCLACSKINC